MQTCDLGGLLVGPPHPIRCMGVINCSPESFFSGSYVPPEMTASRAADLVAMGADIIDIGARSTAPHSHPISVSEERERLKTSLAELSDIDIRVSVDTRYPEVLEACLRFDITAVNDIHGLADEAFAKLLGDSGLPAIVMAAEREPGDAVGADATMRVLDLVMQRAERNGIQNIILDPGIGKWTTTRSPENDWELCASFSRFLEFNRPLIAAISRKSFIGDLLDADAQDRLAGTLGVTYHLLEQGASLVRAHDVKETKHLIKVFEKLREPK
jgi:dihydropteroate synthase